MTVQYIVTLIGLLKDNIFIFRTYSGVIYPSISFSVINTNVINIIIYCGNMRERPPGVEAWVGWGCASRHAPPI
jgi:hypothetical protein